MVITAFVVQRFFNLVTIRRRRKSPGLDRVGSQEVIIRNDKRKLLS
jgi:hypothetical protein